MIKDKEFFMEEKKAVLNKSVNIMAKFAIAAAKLSVNSRCVCIYHQPKMPEVLSLGKDKWKK